MGLLTDPSGGQGKFTKTLLKFYVKLCTLLYLAGVIWFCMLASPSMNGSTYFSENALLPGLVKSMFQEDRTASMYHEQLLDEMQKHKESMPTTWLTAKFRQIGLDTYTHNFSLQSPLTKNEVYHGKNIYGILRAPRASSTEALVLSVPFRSWISIHPTTSPSIAIMLAFAKYAIKEKFWAKDIIFLITDHEQLGIQAWLEAYHGVSCGSEEVLDHGDLKGHAGAIQAAINLEFHSTKIHKVDIKVEGLNGQLPNLDLFNLAVKMCVKEGVLYTFKNKMPEFHRDTVQEYFYYLKNLLLMAGTQATGIPNGNHGLFLRFGIQALTLEGFEDDKLRSGVRVGFLTIGRILEGIFRSMNNLLERFHQSFFFYLLPSPDTYISIGLYMPVICLIAGALIIKACAKWCKLQEDLSAERRKDDPSPPKNLSYIKVILMFVTMHLFGVFLLNLPSLIMHFDNTINMKTEDVFLFALLGFSGVSLLIPVVIRTTGMSEENMNILSVFSLLELGTALICIAMNNFSLGAFCGVIATPFALLINPAKCRYYALFQRFFWLLVHPLAVLFAIVTVNSYMLYQEDGYSFILMKALDAAHQAIIFSIVDLMIYGNWMYTVITIIFVPNWLCFWCVSFTKVKGQVISSEKKTN